MPPACLSRRMLLCGTLALPFLPAASRAGGQRIVSVGGAVTEILYRLGREGDIVGVDSTSQYPGEALKTKPNVGYVRALGAEGILSLKPSLVIAVEGAGPPDVLRLVEGAGISVVKVPDEPSEEGVLRRIAIVSRAVGAEEVGARLVQEVRDGFATLAAARASITTPKRVLFILSLQNGRPLVGGRGTTADGILTLAGARNAGATLDGWKPLSEEGVIAARPDAVVMMSRHGGEAAPDPFALPAFSATPAARERALIVMDGLYLLGFGPRTPQAALDLLTALHPQALGKAAERG